MRQPNPPRILLGQLAEDQQRKVIRLALLVVADLAAGRDWAAFEQIEFEQKSWQLEEKLAFGSLLDSQQAATIVSMREASDRRR